MALHKGLKIHQSEIPSSLSPTYSGNSKNVSETRLASEFGKIRSGSQASFSLCMLQFNLSCGSGRLFNRKYWNYPPNFAKFTWMRQFMSLIGLLTAAEK